MREFEGFQIQTVADDPRLAERSQELIERVWPKFVTQSNYPKGHPLPFDWFGIFERWPHLQFVLIDPADGGLVAACNALTVGAGLLAPLHVDRAADVAVCMEPNVWMEHPLTD